MDGRIEKLLTQEKSFRDVNLDSQSNLWLKNTTRPLPLNKINKVISQSEQMDKERQASNKYRFYGSIKPVISNALYNNNIRIFLEKEEDPDGVIQTVIPEVTLTSVVQSPDIVEDDGWFGYYDKDKFEAQEFTPPDTYGDNKSSLCEFIPFDPGYNRLSFLDSDGSPNYFLKITYPAYSRDDIALVTNGNDEVTLADGIAVTDIGTVSYNNRDYTSFRTAIKHGLVDGDDVNLYGFTDLTGNRLALLDRTLKVFKLGDQLSDDKDVVFVIDISPLEIDINLGRSTFKRVVNGVESSYYSRVFSAMTTDEKDYEIFPAGFAENIYNDKEAGFNFINDIDIDPDVYRDNLGRPLSEVYLTIIKIDEDINIPTIQDVYWDEQVNQAPFWTERVPGFITTKNSKINYNIKGFGGDDINTTYFPAIDETDTEFVGDIVEYNTEELRERILSDIYHRFNTTFREEEAEKLEGYMYKPHYRIKIRDFSTYIEDGDVANTVGIPDYATLSYSGTNGQKVYKWRDFLDVGIYDEGNAGVDYPFNSGAHYVFLGNRFYLRRQDPPCDFEFTDITLNIPTDNALLTKYLIDPKFVQILSMIPPNIVIGANGDPADEDEPVISIGPGSASDVTIELRMVEYYGDYDLGNRDVPGGCVDIGLIGLKDISNVC